jgi:asparagine synthase (glutamine-hydrolysing)
MCGICGAFGTGDIDTVNKMLPLISYRGPDDEYAVSGEQFCMGARRLSIIDVEGGRQPLCNEEGDVWVAQNGEIYNFLSIRERLLEEGHFFRTRCDTEVLAHLYESAGETFYREANGLFAISLWDDRRKKGILVRDRAGKKPLYYTLMEGVLYYASEIKCLLQVPGFQKRLNHEALHYFLSYKHVPHPLTIFEGISTLPPGSALCYQPRLPLKVTNYLQPDFSPMDGCEELTEEELADMIIETLREAVRRRLISDVPMGFFLSGGLDSSLSTALAAEMSSGPIETFTLIYGPRDQSEGKLLDLEYARQISDIYGTEHHEETVSSINFKDEFPRIISHFDEPFSGVISTYFLARLIGAHVKVALSGDGADELFASYLSHRIAQPIRNYVDFTRTGDPRYQDYPLFEENVELL